MDSDRGMEPAYWSVPLKESTSHQHSVIESCDLSIHTKFLNYSGRPISLGFRRGMVVDVPSRQSRNSQAFIVRQELYFSDNIKHSVRDRLISHEGPKSEDLKNFEDLFLRAYRDQTHSVTMRYDYEVTPRTINDNGGCIYLVEQDIILSTKHNDIPLHPFSFEAMTRAPKGTRTLGENGLSVEIIDNQERIGPRYMRLLGKVMRIDAVKNALKRDGVYLKYRGLMTTSQGPVEDIVDYIPPEAMPEAKWLYRSFAEARTAPEHEVELGFELKHLDLQGKKTAAETSNLKAEQDKEKLELEHRNAQLQAQLEEEERRTRHFENELNRRYAREDHATKIEQLRTKDYFEERSIERKDSSEMWKFIPTVVMGAGAAIVALKSLFSN
ncbi:hypothetical protein AVU38_gp116 [Ralstonia phage RSL2]|uniref:hypothetical protein n=1 Tax=Ralstonia phage RSL2 TaxID=1585840 RepID=UPI00054A863E|nr:hypothetical protein AVU38_gp116 [Ralstonia phage RSL2]